MPDRAATDKYSRRRLDILMAAASVFAEKGFHGCRTQDIADRLNLKQASLYYYFPTKESALEAVCLYAVEEATNRIRQITQATGTPLAKQIHDVIHAYLHDLDTHLDCMIVLAEQRRYLSPEQQVAVRAQTREYRTLLQQMLEEARASAQLRADIDCELAARALIDLCHCAALRLQRHPEQDAKHIIDQYSQLFCKGIER
jgi:AcrR family transcriptional regulator